MIYQAVFGDKDGSYTLLDTNHPDKSVAARICNSTDLRSRPGPGVVWKSSVRGFPVGQYYVVMKTYLDTSPNVRFNRVFTHSFIIESLHVHEFDLSRIFSFFSIAINKELKLVEFDPEDLKSSELQAIDSNKLAKVWRGFLDGKIVVWLGDDDFESGVARLWANMPSTFRRSFEFELSFNPSQIDSKGKYVLINSPASQRIKWENDARFMVVNLDEQDFRADDLESFLSGDKLSQQLRRFVSESSIRVDDFEKLRAVNAIYKAFKEVDNCDFQKANTALLLAQKYMPESKTNQAIKERLFLRMEQLLRTANTQLVYAVRKLKIVTGIREGHERLCKSLYDWSEAFIFSTEKNNTEKVYQVIGSLTEEDVEEWWKSTIHRFLINEIARWNDEKAFVLSLWLKSESSAQVYNTLKDDLIRYKHLVETKTAEAIFVHFKKDQAEKLRIGFATDNLLVLHSATLLVCEHNDTEILEKQLSIESKDSPIDALLFLKQKLGSERFLVASLAQQVGIRLVNIIANIIEIEVPVLVKYLSIDRELDQEVLLALSKNTPLHRYFKDFNNDVVYPLLDQMINRVHYKVTPKLIATLDTDLFKYPNRSKIWSHINSMNGKLITNTAKVCLENLDLYDVGALESPLRSEIISSEAIGWYLSKYKRNLQRGLDLFENFHELTERHLQDFLYFFDSEITSIDSKRLGELIRDRKWKMCAGIIYSKCKDLPSFRIALSYCFEELSMWDRLAASWYGYANNGKINENDFWSSLLDVACRLFPEGPKQNKIWKEAGGDNSDLIAYGSGKEIWRDALIKLKSGAYEEITVKSVLNQMLHLYPNNSELKFLKRIRKEIWRES